MRGIVPTLALPIAALAASLFASDSAIAQSPFDNPELDKVDLCPKGGACGTARLKGVDVTFDFKDHGGNKISYTWQCEGLKYPEKPWPVDCSVMLKGPEIDEGIGIDLTLKFAGPKSYAILDRDRIPVKIARRVTTASIPSEGCFEKGKCVATFLGYKDVTFDYKDKTGNSFGYSWQCEGLDYPAKPWPEHCSIMPDPSWQRNDGSARNKIEKCSPVCVVRTR